MTIDQIYFLLRIKKLAVAAIARDIKVDQSNLAKMIRGKKRMPEARKKFCERIGESEETIFDEVWEASVKAAKRGAA